MRPARVPARARLTDDMVDRFPLVAKDHKPYRVQDTDAPPLWVVVTSKNRIFLVRKEAGGKSKDSRIGRRPEMTVTDARFRAAGVLDAIDRGEDHKRPRRASGATLADAWAHYQKTLVRGRKTKSPRTIGAYEAAFKLLGALHDVPLKTLAEDTQRVAEEHERISRDNGETTADATMRFLRACYRAYAKSRLDPTLRPEMYPTSAIVWHNKKRTEKGLGSRELKKWFADLLALESPVRRELHCFTLLTGIRRGDADGDWVSSGVTTLRWEDVSVLRREVTLQNAKGGRKVVLPISRAALRCLLRARAAGRKLYPIAAAEWCFASSVGRTVELKETSWRRDDDDKAVKVTRLAPVGHALRNSFETLGRAAGVERFRCKLLMGHAVDADITDSYTNVPALRDQLRESAETIASFIVRHAGNDPDDALTARLREQINKSPSSPT